MSEARTDDASWSLIARAAAGEGRARSAFGRTYLPVVRGFLAARWRGTPLDQELEDAVQEVFVECLREGGALSRADPARGDFGGLLFGVTRNVAGRFEQRARAARDLASDGGSAIEVIRDREPGLSVLFDRDWARTLVRLAGERMRVEAGEADPAARSRIELLRLRFAEGRPIREIAARWEAAPEAVHRAYARARDEFRGCLRQVVAEHAVRSEAELDAEVDRILQLLI